MLHNICIVLTFNLYLHINVKYVYLLLHKVIAGVKWFTTALTVRIQVQRQSLSSFPFGHFNVTGTGMINPAPNKQHCIIIECHKFFLHMIDIE